MAPMIPALAKIKPKQTKSSPYSNGHPNRVNQHHPPMHHYPSSTNQPPPLPPPQAKQPQTKATLHSSTPIPTKPTQSKSKSSNPTQLTIVFYGHRQYQASIGKTMDGEIISEIKFNKIVFVQSLRVCNFQEKPHAQLLPDFIGRTQPQTLDLYVSARDCSNKERSFVSLVDKALKFNVKSDGKKSKRRSVQNQKIPTDHIYIRGKFNTISLIVYGYIDDKLTQSLKGQSIQRKVFEHNTYDNMFLLDLLDEFEFNGVNKTHCKPTINIPKKTQDADGMLFDPSLLCTYCNLKVLRYDYFDVSMSCNMDNIVLMSKVCLQLLELYPIILKIQSIESIENKIDNKDSDKIQQFVDLRENVLNLLCGGVCVEIINVIDEENMYNEYKFVVDIIEMCCQQMMRRSDVAIYLDFLYVFFRRIEIKNCALLLQYFVERKGMNGHCILYELILDESIACITRISVLKLLSVMIESEYGMTVFLRPSNVSMMKNIKFKQKKEKKEMRNGVRSTQKAEAEDDDDVEMKDNDTNIMSGLQILVKLSVKCDNDDMIEAIKPIFQQVSTYRRMNTFCEWNEANSTNLILPMIDARYWQKSLSLTKMLRNMLEKYLSDCIKPDKYEQETRLLFKTARSDPCCLMPKTANLATWHIRYFKQFKIIPTLNNYLTLLETKIEKLQSPKEAIISNSDDDDDDDDDGTTKSYAMRHQKIALFRQIKNSIIGILLCLTSTLNGCYILSEYDVDLFGLFCGLNKELKENGGTRNGMDIDNKNENDVSHNRAQISSYYGTPRLSELLNDSANNRPIRGKDVCNAICRQLQVLVLIHHMNHSEKESTPQLRCLYLLDLLSNYKENMESIAFGLFYTKSFASICELIWLAFNPQDRTIINPSGFTAQGIKFLLYLLQSQYFANIVLNPLYFEFFQQLLTDFATMHQSLENKIMIETDEKKDIMMDVDKEGDTEDDIAAVPSFMEILSTDIQRLMGILQPVVKLREQGFNAILKTFATLIGFEPAKVGGDYDIDLEFFHLRFPSKHTIDIDNKSILHSLNSIVSILIESASCPAIIELLASESFINMVPIVLRTFVNFFGSSQIASDGWYFPGDNVLLENDEERHWNERCELILQLLGNTLHLTYIYLNEIYAANAFIYPYNIAAELFEVQRIISSRVWQHDMGSFTRNNHYFTHIVDPMFMSSHSFVDCIREYSNDYMVSPPNPLLQSIYESMAGIFAFTLCSPTNNMQHKHCNIGIEDDGVDDTVLYPDKFEIEEFLQCLIFEPQLYVTNLLTLHQCLIHVTALGLKQHWIQRLRQPTVQRRLRVCMKNLALSSDFYIHQVLPCVYLQLSQLDINVAKNILNPFIEMLFSQFLSQQSVSNSVVASKWQLIRLCKCLSWMLRDAWCISLVAPQILSKYINNPLFDHKIDETPMNQLLQKINEMTSPPQTTTKKEEYHHHRSSHRPHSYSHSHSRSRSRHSRRKHKHHKPRSNKNSNNNKEKEEIVLKCVDRSVYYGNSNCWMLDPRIVRILYLKTDGLLTKLFQYISQTESGLVVAVTDILQCALTYIPCVMSGFDSIETLLPSSNDIGVILSHLNTVLQAAQFTSTTQTVINEFQWRFWMCCFIIYGRIASLPNININIVIKYFPHSLIAKILSSSLSFLKSYANTNMSHNFNLHVSEKLQCLIIITWFISMIAKHVHAQHKYVNTKQIEWKNLYKTQFKEIVIVLNKLNEIGFNHIITEIEYCHDVFLQNESMKQKEDDDDDDENENENDIDIDIVLDNDCEKQKKEQEKEKEKGKTQKNEVILTNTHNIKEEILLSSNTNNNESMDDLIHKMYDNGRLCKYNDNESICFGDSLWYKILRESTINWWHNNMLSIIRLCSYSTNYDFSVYPPSVYVEMVGAIPSMMNPMQNIPNNAQINNIPSQQRQQQMQQQMHHQQQQQRINKMNKVQQSRMSGTDRFRSNNYTGGRAPSIHVDDFQSDPNMITANTPRSNTNNAQQSQSVINANNKQQQQQTTIHVPVPSATATHQQYPQTILVPSTATPRIIQSSINPMAAALLQRQQIAAAQQQINQMNQINLIRNAAAQQQKQQQQQHLLRR